jgi:UrcA family protein
MKTLVTLASAAIIGLAVLNVAQADEASPKSRTVQFADLDLSKPEGIATLFSRIKGAAKAVCSAHSTGTTLRDEQRYEACMDFAVSNAIARVDEPVLTDYVASRTGKKSQDRIASNK